MTRYRSQNYGRLLAPALLVAIGIVLWAGAQSLQAAPSRGVRTPTDGTEPLPPGAAIETLLANLDHPVDMAFDPQGRLFFTEKVSGNVRLYQNGVLQASPVITYSVDGTCSERGLLGIAVDPAFSANHFIYVYYTHNSGSACGATQNRVARFLENNG